VANPAVGLTAVESVGSTAVEARGAAGKAQAKVVVGKVMVVEVKERVAEARETVEGAKEAEGLEAAAMDEGVRGVKEMAVAETVVEAKVAATVEAEAAVRTTTSCPQRAPRRQSETRPAHTRSRMMRR
jgi:hypothetical protein